MYKTSDFAQRAQLIKAFIFDVDGVLTDAGVIYDDNGLEYKRFNAKDGLIIRALPRLGFLTGGITGRNSPVVRHRFDELKVSFQYHGISQKGIVYEQIKKDFSLIDSEIAYIGDDLNDLPILTQCGLAACPADASPHVLMHAHYACKKRGGEGAFREFAEAILYEKQLTDALIALFWPLSSKA